VHGSRRKVKGSKLKAQSSRLKAQGSKLKAQGLKLKGQGIRREAYRIRPKAKGTRKNIFSSTVDQKISACSGCATEFYLAFVFQLFELAFQRPLRQVQGFFNFTGLSCTKAIKKQLEPMVVLSLVIS